MSNPYTYKTLSEINDLLRSDPEYYRFYFWRINHYARNSKNEEIRELEILHMENKKRNVIISEARESYDRVKQIREKSPDDEECEILVRDLEKVFELDEIFEKFSAKLYVVEQTQEGVLSVKPTNSIEYFARGCRSRFFNNIDSKNDLQKVIESSPNQYEAMYKTLTDCFDLSGFPWDSSKITEIAPNFAEGVIKHGSNLSNDQSIREYNRAIALLKMMSNVPDILYHAYFLRGLSHFQLGNYDQAIRDLSYIIVRDSDNINWELYIRGRCYLMKEWFVEAIVDFSEIIRRDQGLASVSNIARELRNKTVQKLKEKIMKM